jgi:hypothetical protein
MFPQSAFLFPGDLISFGGTGAVYSARLHGTQPAAVKCFRATSNGEAEMLEELVMYGKVQHLQGVSVPTVLAYGLLDHTFTPFIALSLEGGSLASSGVVHHHLSTLMIASGITTPSVVLEARETIKWPNWSCVLLLVGPDCCPYNIVECRTCQYFVVQLIGRFFFMNVVHPASGTLYWLTCSGSPSALVLVAKCLSWCVCMSKS